MRRCTTPFLAVYGRHSPTILLYEPRIKQHADRKRRHLEFEIGDWEYVKLQPYRKQSTFRRASQLLWSFFGDQTNWPGCIQITTPNTLKDSPSISYPPALQEGWRSYYNSLHSSIMLQLSIPVGKKMGLHLFWNFLYDGKRQRAFSKGCNLGRRS